MMNGLYRVKACWRREKNILIRGCSAQSRHLLLFCMQQDLPIAGFLADGPRMELSWLPVFQEEQVKSGQGYAVIESAEDLMERDPESEKEDSCCLTGEDWETVRRQLLQKGVPEDKIFVDYYTLENCRGYYVRVNPAAPYTAIRYHERQIQSQYFAGKAIFDRLSSDTETHYVFPGWWGKGDTVLMASLMQAYRQKESCKRLTFIAARGHEEILSWFPAIDRVMVFDMESRKALTLYLYLSPDLERKNICFCSFMPEYCGLGKDWSTLEGTPTMVGLFKNALGLPMDAPFAAPRVQKANMMENPSILVVPQANGLYQVMDAHPETAGMKAGIRTFLERLCETWIQQGYCVYCNLGGPEEICILGTIPLRLSLTELLAVCHEFTYIYSVRTGLADALSLAGCRMRILNCAPITDTMAMFNHATDLCLISDKIVNDYWSPESCLELEEKICTETDDLFRRINQ